MVVTFCGHTQFCKTEEYEQKMLAYLEENVADSAADMYLGGYGDFDNFAYDCCKKYKKTHPKVTRVFVTPYLTLSYQKNHLDYQKARYDLILYPDIEDKPKRLALLYRNKYMIEKADFVVAYVSHNFGGAYTTYKYAKKCGKKIFNLADFDQ